MVKTWDQNVFLKLGPFKPTQSQMSQFVNRFVGLESGDPYAAIPGWNFQLNSRLKIIDQSDQYVLVQDGTNRLGIYNVNQKEALHWQNTGKKLESAALCYPLNSGYFYFWRDEDRASETKFISILNAQGKSFSKHAFLRFQERIQLVFSHQNHWYAVMGPKGDLWDLESKLVIELPSELRLQEHWKATWLENVSEPTLLLEWDTKPHLFTLWEPFSKRVHPIVFGRILNLEKTTDPLWALVSSRDENLEYKLFNPRTWQMKKIMAAQTQGSGGRFSPEASHMACAAFSLGEGPTDIWDLERGEMSAEINAGGGYFTSDGQGLLAPNTKEAGLGYWRLQHPEAWYGILCTLEFWITLILLGALGWSIRRDFRALRNNTQSA